MESRSDVVLRAITEDGAYRVIVAETTATARGTVASQGVKAQLARDFADLVTGIVLVRETMAPDLRVQGILKGSGGRGALIADANPDGTSRGMVQLHQGAFALGNGALLQVMRTMPNGGINQGIVDVPLDQGIQGALMAYMQESEQIVSVLAVGTVVRDGLIERAGGYLVQLLPEASRGVQMVMTERLAEFPSIESILGAPGYSPAGLLDDLLYAMPYALISQGELGYACRCSEERVLTTLATLGEADLIELIEGGEVLDICCDYCGKSYAFEPETLRILLREGSSFRILA